MSQIVKPASPLELSLIIPARDEALCIGRIITSARDSLAAFSYEVIVVNDGSTDDTGQIAEAAGATVVFNARSRGKGFAMKVGAEKTAGDIIVFIDGDGAHDPADISAVIAPILEGRAGLVIGSRALPGSRVPSPPLVRWLASNLASFAATLIVSFILPFATMFRVPVRWIRITDATSGFRAIKADGWRRLDITADGFEVEMEMIYEAARKRMAICEVPIGCNWNPKLSRLSVVRDGLATLKLLTAKLIKDAGGRHKEAGPR